jgi:hypothetical protein
MPINKKDYHPDWPRISLEVREAAGQRCEWCGAPNKAIIQRRKQHRFYPPGLDAYQVDWVLTTSVNTANGEETTEGMSWPRLKFHGLTRIILTVAHLDRNSQNNDRENLAALCQRCHLSHDIHQHIANRKYGRRHAKDHQFKLELS